ncbi:hypothetical protein J6590_051159 [Homalodisca vitripennis]|nr:hypothetical protein J6590_051159 [Homalodisca vitripennis]
MLELDSMLICISKDSKHRPGTGTRATYWSGLHLPDCHTNYHRPPHPPPFPPPEPLLCRY